MRETKIAEHMLCKTISIVRDKPGIFEKLVHCGYGVAPFPLGVCPRDQYGVSSSVCLGCWSDNQKKISLTLNFVLCYPDDHRWLSRDNKL